MTETEIDGHIVPIEPGAKSTIWFSGGRVESDKPGDREFWTAVHVASGQRVTARCVLDDDPGNRFRLMEKSPPDADGWKVARQADYLRPANGREVEAWLNAKPGDAPHAGTGQISGKNVRVVNEKGRYQIVPGTS